MKILLDNIIYSNVSQGGVSNYWYELSKFLLGKHEDTILFYEESDTKTNFHRNQLCIPDSQLIINNNSFNSSIRRRLSSVKLNSEYRLDYFLYHSSYYRPISGVKPHSEVTTVHDFTHNYFASYLKRIAHNNLKYKAIKRSDGIICISDSTYKDLKRFCPPSKNQKVEIIHNGVSKDYYKIEKSNEEVAIQYLQSLGINNSYLLYIGSRVNYKNFAFSVKLFNEVPEFNLVIIGPELTQNELKLFNKASLNRIHVISNVINSDLNILYNFAHALLYPSSYEGFGIPIIEAMKAGCPVLALNNSSITEISGSAGILYDTLDIELFKKALLKLKNVDFKEDLVAKGFLQSNKYSWDKCCRETYEFYKAINL